MIAYGVVVGILEAYNNKSKYNTPTNTDKKQQIIRK